MVSKYDPGGVFYSKRKEVKQKVVGSTLKGKGYKAALPFQRGKKNPETKRTVTLCKSGGNYRKGGGGFK